MGKAKRIVVIGGVAAGMSAASAAKRVDPSADVTVLEKSEFVSYGACSIPYYISDEIKHHRELIAVTPESAQQERGVAVRTRWEVSAIDPSTKQVAAIDTDKGRKEKVSYDKLIIATGALPVRPALPGIDLQNVFTLRTLEDAIAVKGFVDGWKGREHPKVVIVGGGYIGLEMSESFRKRGCEVRVVEKMDRVLGTMDTSVTDVVEKKLESEGVGLFKGTSVTGFEGEGGRVASVVTDRGTYPAHLVIVSIGVKPNARLAAEAGIALGVNGAIDVDEKMRTNVTDIYAAGDCADSVSLVTGKKTYIPLGTTANKQGRVAGENAAGRETIFDGIAGTAQTKIFDLEVARTGLSGLEAEREKLDFFASTIQGRSRAKAYPAGKPIFITYVVERGTGRLLGAQMVGQEGVALRIDTLAACLYGRMTVDDVARLDLGYAPPFATVWDPILIAANVALKKLGKR